MRELKETEDFNTVVGESKVCVVDFFATWCKPCTELSKLLTSMDLGADVMVLKVNVDLFDFLAEEYSVSALPTLLFFKNGVFTNRRHEGFDKDTQNELTHVLTELHQD